MEGTRNEKALLVLCSYVIGFTTSYIAYGITYATFFDQPVESASAYTAAVADINYEAPLEEMPGVATLDLVGNELNVNVAGERRLVSVHAEEASLSPSSEAVYFCETAETGGCTQYEYSIAEDLIRPRTEVEVGESVDAVMVE